MARLSPQAAAILATAPPLPLDAEHWQAIVKKIGLSEKQAEVAELVLRDLSNNQIALVMDISAKTVDQYLQDRIPKKTRTRGRMQLAMRVLEVAFQVRPCTCRGNA